MDYANVLSEIYADLAADNAERALMGCLRISRSRNDYLHSAIFLRELFLDNLDFLRALHPDVSHLKEEAQKLLYLTSAKRSLAIHTLDFSLLPDKPDHKVLRIPVNELDSELEELRHTVKELVVPPNMDPYDTAAFTDNYNQTKAVYRLRMKGVQTIKARLKALCQNYASQVERQLDLEQKHLDFLDHQTAECDPSASSTPQIDDPLLQTPNLKKPIFETDFKKMKDFFVSYTHADKAWAEWIAWQLEEAGFSTIIQAWDFRPGANFVLEMQTAATTADRTIAVISQKYLESSFTASEWASAFAQDPEGKQQKLIPIRVAPCELSGILAPIIYLDLVGLPETDATAALLGAFSARKKPDSAPVFPGAKTFERPHAFPGTTATTSAPVAESLLSKADASKRKLSGGSPLSVVERMEFAQQLNELPVQQFNILIFAIKPPPGVIPPMPAPQGDRTFALLTWAEGTGGCGVAPIQELFQRLTNPQ